LSVLPGDRRLAVMEIIDIHMSIKKTLDDAIARAVAVGGLVAIALIHVLQLPDAFDEIGYLGALFIAAIIGSLLLASMVIEGLLVFLTAAVLLTRRYPMPSLAARRTAPTGRAAAGTRSDPAVG
jgi:hypothetical protein